MTRRILLVEPAARTSHEHETWRAIPDSHLTVVSDRGGWDADETVVLPARRLPVLGRYEMWTAALAWLRGLDDLDVGPVDVVVSCEVFSPFSLQANRLARRLGAAHVISIAETLPRGPLHTYPPYRQMGKSMARRADGFVCLTDAAREAAEAIGCPPERCVVVNPGVDTNFFTPAADLDDRPRVLFVGMLRADKGADKGVFDIIAACSELAQSEPDLELLMVGEGPLRDQIEAGLDRWPFVRLLGRLPRAELPELFRSCRCLVLASRRTWKWEEQFGYVLAEAMASGLPVVGTRSGAIPEVIGPDGLLAEPDEISGLAKALAVALGPSGERRGRDSRTRAEECFDLAGQGRRLDRALGALLDGVTAP